MSDLVLCYVDDPWAYFTSQPLEKQWGDDWGDAPYEHNSGPPYTWRTTIRKEVGGKIPWTDVPNPEPAWKIVKIAFEAHNLEDPSAWTSNSGYSVQQINLGRAPWLSTYKFALSDVPQMNIYAGCTLTEFAEKIREARGIIYTGEDST